MSTKPETNVESSKGSVISDPLRNIPVVSDLSETNTVLDSRRNVGMIGINQPLSTVRIHKRQVQEDDEMIEVNYDSPEERTEKVDIVKMIKSSPNQILRMKSTLLLKMLRKL